MRSPFLHPGCNNPEDLLINTEMFLRCDHRKNGAVDSPGNGRKVERVDTDSPNGVSETASILGWFNLAGDKKPERLKKCLFLYYQDNFLGVGGSTRKKIMLFYINILCILNIKTYGAMDGNTKLILFVST